jgi:GNAT superfamily N-acetyltransferase
MTVARIESDEEILSTREVMLQLRPHIAPDDFLPLVRRLMRDERYRLAAAIQDGVVRAVAGYRIFETLYCTKLLSLDDLVTDERSRSGGHGHELMEWLKEEGRREGCTQIHLVSRVHRVDAHRFYFRERFGIHAFFFVTDL